MTHLKNVCMKCDAELDIEEYRCPHCDGEVEEIYTCECSNCGWQQESCIEDECEQCGYEVEEYNE